MGATGDGGTGNDDAASDRTRIDRPAADPFDRCAHCGARLRSDVWYPATCRWDDEGNPELYSFCDDACEAAWEAEH